MESGQEKGFTIRDRRTSTSAEKEEKAEPKTAGAPPEKPSEKVEEQRETGPLPEVDFSSFIISLASTAQMSMGNIPHPETGKTAVSLPAAKQMIDILGMIRTKTKGNLTSEEETLIEQILYNLRMHYVRVVEGTKKT